jgi:hypothetical protein
VELETLFTEQKWNILHLLSTGDYSPIQLSSMMNTTISNISQQLRLLEAARLVKKKKISNRDKGKPRTLFSLSEDYAYLISVTKNFTSKKLMLLTDYHKSILKIWGVTDASLHPRIAQAYMSIFPSIQEFDCVFISEKSGAVDLNLVYNGSKEAARLALAMQKDKQLSTAGLGIVSIHRETMRRKQFSSENNIVLYDPNNMIKTSASMNVETQNTFLKGEGLG